MSNHKNIFTKGSTPNWLEEVFVIKKVKNNVIEDLDGEEIIGTFYEKELQKTNETEFRIEKVISKKGDKLYGRVIMIRLMYCLRYCCINRVLFHNHIAIVKKKNKS